MNRRSFFALGAAAPLAAELKPEPEARGNGPALYSVEHPGRLGPVALDNITKQLEPLKRKLGCEFLILEEGMTIKRVP